MALFKIITEDENGNRKLYKDPKDLEGLVHYVYNKSIEPNHACCVIAFL